MYKPGICVSGISIFVVFVVYFEYIICAVFRNSEFETTLFQVHSRCIPIYTLQQFQFPMKLTFYSNLYTVFISRLYHCHFSQCAYKECV
jgi:hypothetical protein